MIRHRGRRCGGLKTKGQYHDDRNQIPPDASCLRGHQERRGEFWQPIGALWEHADGKGFSQRLDYLPLNGAQIVIRSVEDDMQTDDKAE